MNKIGLTESEVNHCRKILDLELLNQSIACSQTLSFLFKVRRTGVIKNKNRGGFIERQRKGVRVGEGVFEKNEKKNKTTSDRLHQSGGLRFPCNDRTDEVNIL